MGILRLEEIFRIFYIALFGLKKCDMEHKKT
jgi:hypothetical protein